MTKAVLVKSLQHNGKEEDSMNAAIEKELLAAERLIDFERIVWENRYPQDEWSEAVLAHYKAIRNQPGNRFEDGDPIKRK